LIESLFDKVIHAYEARGRRMLRRAGFSQRSIPTRIGSIAALDGQGGGKTPIMLVHGFSSESVHYAKLIDLLRPHVGRILVPDLPAHGHSDAPPRGTTAAELRAGIVEAFDHLIDEPTIIFGNSMGGLASLYYALARPEKVKGLMLVSPAGAAMTNDELDTLLGQFRLRTYGDAVGFVDRLLVEPSWLKHAIAWGVKRKFANPQLQALLVTLGPSDLLRPDDLSKLEVPTLLWWGEDDRILPPASFEFFKKHLPAGSIIEKPPRMSHSPYLEDPDGVAARIVELVLALESE
jgi:pimeloyl-ACP methyl ester carboxylesterase